MMTAVLDLVKNAKQLKADSHEFYLNISRWRQFDPGIPLAWQRAKFAAASKSNIPAVRGLYVFTLEAEGLGLPTHGYILYVGITGDKSDANLRKRFAQYLREAKNGRGRPRVVFMLNEWPDDLVFNFMPVPDGHVDLAEIERSFINGIMPPINSADFEADIAAARKAAF